MRECGLKSIRRTYKDGNPVVTPLAGVWIEIVENPADGAQELVTPLAGVWIEIFNVYKDGTKLVGVTPLAGVWIEITIAKAPYACL